MKTKLQVGQIVYERCAENVRAGEEILIKEKIIAKVGNRYFYINPLGFNSLHPTKVDIETMKIVSDVGVPNSIFSSKEEIKAFEERQENISKVRDFFNRFSSHNISNETLALLIAAIENHNNKK